MLEAEIMYLDILDYNINIGKAELDAFFNNFNVNFIDFFK
jgi:hypothetical protein